MRAFILAATIVAILLSGCASPHQLGVNALKSGDLASAEKQLTIAAREGNGAAWNDLGTIYHRQKRIQEAIDAFTMGARYGDPTARANLARNNLPIPPADLAARAAARQPSTEALGIGLEALSRGYADSRPDPNLNIPSRAQMDCTARQTSMGPPMMNRTYDVNCR